MVFFDFSKKKEQGTLEGGMPLATVEAMFCGRVPIVTRCAGSLVDDGKTGFVAAAAALELVDDALERAWQNRDRWPEIGKDAAREIRQQYPQQPVKNFSDTLVELVLRGKIDAGSMAGERY